MSSHVIRRVERHVNFSVLSCDKCFLQDRVCLSDSNWVFFFAIHIFPVIEYLYMHKCICVLNITSFQHKYYHLISIVRIYNFLFLFPFFTISISVHLWFLFVFCLCSNVNTVIICSLSSFKVFSIKYPLSLLYLIIVYMITQFFVPLLYCHHAPNGTFFIYKGKNSAIVTNWFFFYFL